MSLHTWLRQGPRKPRSHATFTLNSHWGKAVTGKRSLASTRTEPLQPCPALRACRLWPARLLCQGGDSPGKNTGGRSAQCWRASWGGEVDCDSQGGEGLTAVTQEKHLFFLCFDLFCGFLRLFSFFPLFSPSVVVVKLTL